MSGLDADALRLLTDGLGWLRTTYQEHHFFVERDLVWTLQKWLLRELASRGTPLRVFNDYGVEPGRRRSLSADLAVLPLDARVPLAVAEFKFEPSQRRTGIDRKKLPVVGWDGVTRDVDRIRDWTGRRLIGGGMAVFIDEGGLAQSRRPALGECVWSGWGTYAEPTLDVWVHTFTAVGSPRS